MMEMDDSSPRFKTQWLNDTLKFIKNDEELIYRYPEWPISRVTFYHALIAQRQFSAGLGFKTLYAPLWEAMQVFGLKYTFKVTITNSKDQERGYLVLEKVPKKSEDDETDSEDESICKHKLTKKNEQVYLANKAVIDKNSPTFIKNTLQSLLDFINDEASASIDFKDLAPIEAKFIQNIKTIHEQKYLFYKIFSPSCIEILKKISTRLSSCNTYNIKVGDVKTNPKTAKREITLTKEPNFSQSCISPPTSKRNKSKARRPAPLRSVKSINPKAIPSLECISNKSNEDISKSKSKKTEKESLTCENREEKQLSNNKEVGCETARSGLSRLVNVAVVTTTNNETPKEIPLPNAKADIQCKINDNKESASSENERKSMLPREITKESPPAENSSKLPLTRSGQKKAIIEAMSKPLESDKGLRMMKLMGWEGGALGLRGEGITEPIIPALHLKPKAGLGAPIKSSNKENKLEQKMNKNTKKNKKITRLKFLEGVYEALDKGITMIHFITPLSEREVTHYTTSILDLNRRSRISHNNHKEKKMVDKILDRLNSTPDVIFEYSFMNDVSELCLQVIKKSGAPTETDEEIYRPLSNEDLPSVADPAVDLPDILIDIDNYIWENKGKPKNKSAKLYKVSIKIYTLMMVLDFLRSDRKGAKIDFSFGYCRKVGKYMKQICEILNDGKHFNETLSPEEVELLNEISYYLEYSFLSLELRRPYVIVRKLISNSEKRILVDYNQVFNNQENNTSDSKTDNDKDMYIQVNEKKIGKHQKLNYIAMNFIEDDCDKRGKNNIKSFLNKVKNLHNKKTTQEPPQSYDEPFTTKTDEATSNNTGNAYYIDLINENLQNKDLNDNELNSEIKTGRSCDTSSVKNKNSAVLKEDIDVVKYKKYNILNIVLQDWEDLENLSRRIQKNILDYDYFTDDNYLKCHGIQNGGLVYSYNGGWFNDVLSRNYNVNSSAETLDSFKMKVHINSYVKVSDVLKSLEIFNRGLYTTDWSVLKEGNCYFVVDVDCDSFKFVCDHRFSLYAGIDTALFTIVL